MPKPRSAIIDDAIRNVLASSSRSQPLSLRAAVARLRAIAGDIEPSDRELAELLALHAMSRGFAALKFDVGTNDLNEADVAGIELETPSLARLSQKERIVLPYMPALQQKAGSLGRTPEEASRLVERTVDLAIATVDSRPVDHSLEDWLDKLLRQVVAQPAAAHRRGD